MTSEEYLQSMELKAKRKEEARLESERRKAESEKRKETRAADRRWKDAEKLQRQADARAREAFKQQWSAEAIREAGERLQWLVKHGPPPPPTSNVAPFCGILPPVCKENMARRLAKRRASKEGNVAAAAGVHPATPPPWVHKCDPRFVEEPPSEF